jgi:asparagine synthase (glutamine-hydrolysing)
MPNQYLGGLLPSIAADHFRERLPNARHQSCPDGELFLLSEGDAWWTYSAGPFTLLLRGYAVPADGVRETREEIAARVCAHYARHGDLPTDSLDGSFTLVLLDGRDSRVLLYRNLVGNGFTYYSPVPGGMLFGSNLAALADVRDCSPRPNVEALPAFFLFRYVPGRDTLFSGIFRLMPGELVRCEDGKIRREQRERLPAPASGRPGGDSADRLDATMRRILADVAAAFPNAANLLSGGVDSTYIQALWNRVAPSGVAPRSFSVCVDHPQTRTDTEYARSAAQTLGTRHQFVAADDSYPRYLVEAIAATGEPPHHVQSAYYPVLARRMIGENASLGLCGQGADALFGLSWVPILDRALAARHWLPSRSLRRWATRLAGPFATPFRRQFLEQADHLDDPTDPRHPLNRVGAYGDWSDLRACFGGKAAARALADRRALLAQFGANTFDLVGQVHACDFLSDSIDTASLWAGLFNAAGGDLLCPYLDSRLVRFAAGLPLGERFPGREPKALLKRALARHVPRQMVYRSKLGFGQPVFEWLSPGGCLRPWAERIARYDFVDPTARSAALARPNWFLVSLLCYDIWHKLFIDRSLPRPSSAQPRPTERVELSVR